MTWLAAARGLGLVSEVLHIRFGELDGVTAA